MTFRNANLLCLFYSVIFSLIAAASLIGTVYDLYKVAKEWYMSAVNKHDLSGLINDSHNLPLQMNDNDRLVKKGNGTKEKVEN